jgi:hypothetical protein
MSVRPGKNRKYTLRLAYQNADGVRGRKLELEQFLSEHGVDIFLLNETYLLSGRALRLANYVCHRTDSPTPEGGTAIFVRQGIDHYAMPVSGLHHLEAIAVHLVFATRPVKLVAAYLSPTRPLIESDLSECLSGVFPVLMAGDINAKHTEWSSRPTTARGYHPRDYAIRNTCLNYGSDSPTTAPCTHNDTHDVLDIVVVKDVVQPVYLIFSSALSSVHLPILIDTTCRLSFQNLLDRPAFTRMD